jgi:hypothetical protein
LSASILCVAKRRKRKTKFGSKPTELANGTGQGYFQALFSCIERLLASLGVKHFVLPAADEAVSIWTQRFGFAKITQDEVARSPSSLSHVYMICEVH